MIPFQCHRCGQAMQAAEEHQGKQTRCPNCQTVVAIPGATQAIMPAQPAVAPPPAASSSSLQNTAPIPLTPQPQGVACPGCGVPQDPAVVVCLRCGFNRKTGKHLTTKVKLKRVDRIFEPSPNLLTRVLIWAGVALLPGFGLILLISGRASAENVLGFALFWLLWAIVWGFGLGTFGRCHMFRDENKEILIVKTQWVCFVPLTFLDRRIFLVDYHRLLTNYRLGVSDIEKTIFLIVVLFLCCMGGFPGLLIWYYVFQKESYLLEISRGPGENSIVLYIGNQDKMNEYAEAILAVAEHLQIDRK